MTRKRAFYKAFSAVRSLRGWIDYNVVGEYDSVNRHGHGFLWHVQHWFLRKAR